MPREYPERPVLAVGAVVVDRGRALLVKRAQEPAKGAWSIPGGKVEYGETLQDAVRREIKEETGLDIEVGRRLRILQRMFRDDSGRMKYHYVLVDYRAVPVGGMLSASSDAADVRYFADSELAGLGLADITLRVVRSALHNGP